MSAWLAALPKARPLNMPPVMRDAPCMSAVTAGTAGVLWRDAGTMAGVLRRDVPVGTTAGVLWREVAFVGRTGVLRREVAVPVGTTAGMLWREVAFIGRTGVLRREVAMGTIVGVLRRELVGVRTEVRVPGARAGTAGLRMPGAGAGVTRLWMEAAAEGTVASSSFSFVPTSSSLPLASPTF